MQNDGLVACAICGKSFERITPQHLKKFHGMSVPEYQVQYPDAETISEVARTRRLEKFEKWKIEHPDEYNAYCKKLSDGMKGIPKPPRSAEHSRHISESKKGKTATQTPKLLAAYEAKRGKKMPEGHAEKLRQANLGKHHSEATKQLLSRQRLGRPIKMPADFKERVPRGPKHYKWKGGVNPNHGGDWPELANSMRMRDNRRCQFCQEEYGRNRPFPVHHIVSASDLNAVGYYPHHQENLITLCSKHHSYADWNKDWSIPFYRNLLVEKYHYDSFVHMEIDCALLFTPEFADSTWIA